MEVEGNRKMMESDIFRIICDNQGAVDTDYLIFNLGLGDSVNEIISNREKFALCCPFGQPRVVARTALRLCRAKDCPGSCRGLHLCKKFLLTGSCPFTGSRRGCRFSHELHSDHNAGLLRAHELERLSRAELRTLLLQSDNWLLPQICHNYNNGGGKFGLCEDGDGCHRLHVCERYMNRSCSCSKTHDFSAPQPNKILQEKGLPDDLIRSLKSVYANILALKYIDRKGDGGNRGQEQLSSSTGAAASNAEASSDNGVNLQQREWYRRRGRGGNRGNRGNRGNNQQQPPTCSNNDNLSANDAFDLYKDDELMDWCSTSDISAAASDTDANSDDGQNRKKNQNKTSSAVRGRGGNRGNHQQQQRTRSTADIPGAVNSRDDGPNRRQKPGPVRDKTEICMYFIKGHCKHDEDRCYKVHSKMPYRWEVREGEKWTALPDNEAIEKDYCDPKNTSSSSSPPVHFDTMTRGSNKVRRLSTTNSLLEPNFIHTTVWVWYWEDQFGKWNEYASTAGGHSLADMDSHKLEQKFLANDKDEVDFTAGSQSYSLSFQDMIQTNKLYSTKRLVKRRPQFVSAADVQNKRVRRPTGQANFTAVPDHWDRTQIPETGYRRVLLQRSSDEFKEVETHFCETMRGFDIVTLERIQNKALWEVFQWQKNQMKNNNKARNVTEKQLFHGTDSKFVDVICHTNFDWRVCGVNGTAFGQGSYFARDAKYSHSYTGTADVKSMFISRVLVGDYTKGSSSYRRPPSKDGGDINFFDSCVDDVMNPSIFVVFEKHQIYPEYLLQYKTMHPLVALYGAAAAPAPAPRPVPAPRPAVQPSVSVYQLGTSVTQPSAPSFKPSTSVTQPSTPSFKPSTSVTQPSTPSFKPSTSVTQPSTPSFKPSTSVTQPSAPSFKPSTSVTQPSTPSIKPTTSVTQPSTPSFKPTTSVTQPSTPSFKPSTSVTQPSTPSIKPTTSVTPLSAPYYRPTTSVTPLSAPYYRPSTSVTQPSAVSFRPSTSVTQLSTPSYQPSRTAYLPSPSPKKKDTCVIA